MKSYRVTWEIDVDAEDARGAAVAAMRMQDEHTTANVFRVREYADMSRAERALARRFDTLRDSLEIDLGDIPRHLLEEFDIDRETEQIEAIECELHAPETVQNRPSPDMGGREIVRPERSGEVDSALAEVEDWFDDFISSTSGEDDTSAKQARRKVTAARKMFAQRGRGGLKNVDAR